MDNSRQETRDKFTLIRVKLQLIKDRNEENAWYQPKANQARAFVAERNAWHTALSGERGYPITLEDEYPVAVSQNTQEFYERCIAMNNADNALDLQYISELIEAEDLKQFELDWNERFPSVPIS